jgi:hypothetical protein
VIVDRRNIPMFPTLRPRGSGGETSSPGCDVVTCTYDHEERCRQITTLLTYSKVHPLSASAIAINLGTSDDEIRAPLESLLAAGWIIQSGDGPYAGSFALPLGRTVASGPGLSHALQREKGEPG